MEPFNITDSEGTTTTVLVRAVKGSRGRAFELIGRDGRPAKRRIEVALDGHSKIREYDALWVDSDGVVHAMAFYAGVRLAPLGMKDSTGNVIR